MSAYLGSNKVWSGAESELGWVRNTDWLPMPDISSSEQKVAALVFIDPNGSNFVALRCSGAYTVNWGDGSAAENIATNTTAEHTYDFANSALANTVTTLGNKQAIVTVTPQSGQNLTSINLNMTPSGTSGGSNFYTQPWLDLIISAPNCTSLSISNADPRTRILERVVIKSLGSADLGNLFLGALALSSVSLTLPNAPTSVTSMFQSCGSLIALDMTNVNFTGVTSLASFLGSAQRLQYLNVAGCNFSGVTSLYRCFLNNYVLSSIDLSGCNFGSVTNATECFNGITSATKVLAPIPVSFSVVSAKLSASALNALYTSLPTVTGQTIYVKGNYGISGHNASIATAKGWTVDTTT
jgi:hypothetical protein